MGTPWGEGSVGGGDIDGQKWDPKPLQERDKVGKGNCVRRGVEAMGRNYITTCQIGVEESFPIPTPEKSMVRK